MAVRSWDPSFLTGSLDLSYMTRGLAILTMAYHVVVASMMPAPVAQVPVLQRLEREEAALSMEEPEHDAEDNSE